MDRVEAATKILKVLAAARITTTYAAFGLLFDIPAIAVGTQLLAPITLSEQMAGRPMLTALVYSADTGLPREYFFDTALRFGRYFGGDKREFWEAELQRVYDYDYFA